MGDWDNVEETVAPQQAEQTTQPKVIKSKKPSNVITYSDDAIKKWILGDAEKPSSNVCCAFIGFDGTAKSGLALDCRNDAEKKAGKKVVAFDLDGGCAPLRAIYHDNDPNIIIKNPTVRDEFKNVDYEQTLLKLKSALDYIERNLDSLNIKALVFDGVDKFLKLCEYSMREDINKEITEGFDRRYWKLRNQKYGDVIEQIRSLDCEKYFITHLKKENDGEGWIPDWEKKTSDLLFQKVRCYREQKVENGDKVIYLKAEIEKCKTNLALEGKTYTISETRHCSDGNVKAVWYGLHFTPQNTITQKKGAN